MLLTKVISSPGSKAVTRRSGKVNVNESTTAFCSENIVVIATARYIALENITIFDSIWVRGVEAQPVADTVSTYVKGVGTRRSESVVILF